ncbi:unnamed protein product [Cylindrotheca closterium]|uniref:PPIase cyclophilin-type domain-containing protein n=1 Tax=Cylindrotheca closterium TaxID=2856 RepID=A0AAD2FNR2_9STRA|nr:unnamed protein product [Cylindrotheca closterium]
MPSELKPRFSSGRKGDVSALLLSTARSYDEKNEKASRTRRKEKRQFRCLLFLVIGLSTVLFHLNATKKIPWGKLWGTTSITMTGGSSSSNSNSISDGSNNIRKGKTPADDVSSDSDSSGDHGGRRALDELMADNKLVRKVRSLDAKVREHKKKPNMIMETDPEGLKLTKELQHWTYELFKQRYGPYKFRVILDLVFPESIPDYKEKGPTGQVTIQMASASLIPCSVFNFLEIARTWKGGAFHRNANHVLQAAARSEVTKSMPFQEYSPEHPHKKGTAGYAGRPSGPGFYISIMDNSINHGPGSQQHHNPHEADANFGDVVEGFNDVVPRIHSVPQKSWLDNANKIKIEKMTIIYNKEDGTGEWHEWGGENKAKYEIAQSK